MTNLAPTFNRCRSQGRKALIPFLTAGYPDKKSFARLVTGMASAGADLIEVGLPFSDPLADGRTIQFSSHASLAGGTTISGTLDRLGELSSKLSLPLVIMSYYNPLREFGLTTLLKQAYQAGVRGLIVPDMIVEESRPLSQAAKSNRIDMIHLLAPTSDQKRTKLVLNHSEGFVYLVSVAGVTGSRKQLPKYLRGWVRKIKSQSDKPICVGFGISTPALAGEVAGFADGVIIGSAIIDLIRNAPSRNSAVSQSCRFIEKVRKAMGQANG